MSFDSNNDMVLYAHLRYAMQTKCNVGNPSPLWIFTLLANDTC